MDALIIGKVLEGNLETNDYTMEFAAGALVQLDPHPWTQQQSMGKLHQYSVFPNTIGMAYTRLQNPVPFFKPLHFIRYLPEFLWIHYYIAFIEGVERKTIVKVASEQNDCWKLKEDVGDMDQNLVWRLCKQCILLDK